MSDNNNQITLIEIYEPITELGDQDANKYSEKLKERIDKANAILKLYNDNRPSIVNRSLNETLNRTIITSVTTLVVVIILFIFGGEVLKPFSITLIIGIIIGTYSSMFIASPVMLYFEEKYPIPEFKDEED